MFTVVRCHSVKLVVMGRATEMPDEIAANILDIEQNAKQLPRRLGSPAEAYTYITNDLAQFVPSMFDLSTGYSTPETHSAQHSYYEYSSLPASSSFSINFQASYAYPDQPSTSQVTLPPGSYNTPENPELLEFFPNLQTPPSQGNYEQESWQYGYGNYESQFGMFEYPQSVSIPQPSMPIPSQTGSAENTVQYCSTPQNKPTSTKPIRNKESRICAHCGTGVSSLWRWSNDGERVCNACGFYEFKNGTRRPKHLRKDTILRRKRNPRTI